MSERARRARAGVAAVLALCAVPLTGCSSAASGPPTLTWYINPDSGGQAEIAARCTEEADGAYRIGIAQLPRRGDVAQPPACRAERWW